ncbi:unnamed protein product, partial [Phaeothamnion confervicola]
SATRQGESAVERVRSWGFTQRLWLWCEVATATDGCGGDGGGCGALKAFVGPLAAMTGACAGLAAAGAAGLPQRLSLVRMQQELAAGSSAFVPAMPLLLGALRLDMLYHGAAAGSSAVAAPVTLAAAAAGTRAMPRKRGGGSDGKGTGTSGDAASTVDLFGLGRLPKELARAASVRVAAVAAVTEHVRREGDLYRHSVGAPEYLGPLAAALADAAPHLGATTPALRSKVRAALDGLNKAIAVAVRQRGLRDEAPGDIAALEALKRMDDPPMARRLAAAAAATEDAAAEAD